MCPSKKGTDTSLIERFMYPKFGPGQLWEARGGVGGRRRRQIHMSWKVEVNPSCEGSRVISIDAVTCAGERRTFAGELLLSDDADARANYGDGCSDSCERARGERRLAVPRFHYGRAAGGPVEGEGA